MSSTEGTPSQVSQDISGDSVYPLYCGHPPLHRRCKSASSFPPPQKLHTVAFRSRSQQPERLPPRRSSTPDGSRSQNAAGPSRLATTGRTLPNRGGRRGKRKRQSRLSLGAQLVIKKHREWHRTVQQTPQEEAAYQDAGCSRVLPYKQGMHSQPYSPQGQSLQLSKQFKATSRFLARQQAKPTILQQTKLGIKQVYSRT